MREPSALPTRRRSRGLAAAAFAGAGALALSLCTVTPAYAAPTHSIGQLQGTGAATPIPSGQVVTVQGVVTADYSGPSNYDGYVIQAQTPDTDPLTSDAIFVYLGSTAGDTPIAFAEGDLVEVTGTVSEFRGLTQLTQQTATLVTAGVGTPAPVTLPESVLGADREPFEHMLVTLPDTYRLASTHNVSSFGELWLQAGDEPLVKSTETVDVTEADAIAAANAQRLLLVDDGWSRSVTADEHPGTQPWLTGADAVRNGDSVSFAADDRFILSYGFDRWRLQPTEPITAESPAGYDLEFTSAGSRPTTAPTVGGDLQIAAFNVLNYFTTLSTDNPDARGAETPEQFELQEDKIVQAITGLNADVVALQEIENSVALGEPRDEALAALVAALNEVDGAGAWDYARTPAELGADNTDVIMNAIIFRTDAVQTVGAATTVTDETVWGNAREPIAQVFRSGDLEFAVVANHFKSKGGDDGVTPNDQQGEFNADRVAQANSLLTFAAGLPTDDIVLVGDFNSYTEEDPAQAITAAGYTDVVSTHAEGQYTYTFDGELGSLDHMFLSASMNARITGAGVWSINSPEWSGRQYDGEAPDGTVYRSSDHDPIVAGFSNTAGVSEIDVFGINDFHGHLEQVVSRGAVTEPGAALIAGALNQFRAENPSTVFVSAGDNIGASTFTSFVQNDEPTLDVLNEMDLAVAATGNHEFDQGIDDLTGRVDASSDFPYIAANVYRDGARIFDPYYTQTFGATTVAFVGAVTEDLPSLVSPAGMEGVEVRDIVTEVNQVAAQLSDGDPANGEADVVILTVHEGAPTAAIEDATGDNAFGDIVTGVNDDIDAILSAHTHQLYAHDVDGMPVVQGGQYGTNLSHLTITVDPETGDLVDIVGATVPLTGAAAAAYTPDPEVQEIVDAAVEQANELGARPLGAITADVLRAVNNPTDEDPRPENRGGESTLGNFVADVQVWATQQQGTDFALMNPGGLRADLTYESSGTAGDADGIVTYREAATVQPFANTLVALDLTGAQLKSVLEEQWQPADATRPFLKLGVSEALTYTYDPTAPAGEHITAIYVNGELVSDDDVFRVATNSFLASGGDNFGTLAEGTNRADTGRVDLAAMVDWFEEFGEVSPPSQQRAVGAVLNTPADGSYAPGETVELSLSSLAFTNGEFADADEVQVSLNGQVLATGPIDRTISDAFDETGRATLTFAAPATGSGPTELRVFELEVTVPGTDTRVLVPIVLEVPVGTPGGTPLPGGPGASPAGDLASTGAEVASWLLGAVLAMLLAGGVLVLRSRRTRADAE